MTLSTKVLIREPHAVATVRDWINAELFGCPDAAPDTFDYGRGTIVTGNRGGQGLPAWLVIEHRADGPIDAREYIGDDQNGDEVYRTVATGSMIVDFDTGYSYRDERGRGCQELHMDYIGRLVERFGPVLWCDEFTGEWHEASEEVSA